MAEHGPQTVELVEVKAEDIVSERQSFYDRFMTGSTWAAGAVVVVLVLMWLFMV